MDFGDKFEDKLIRLIEKHGKRPFNIYDDAESSIDLEDTRCYTHYFHYEKRKDEVFAFNDDFKIKKDKKKKHEFSIIIYDEDIADNLREISEHPELFREIAEIDVETLCYTINDLRIKSKLEKYNNEHVKRILKFTEELFGDIYTKIDNLIKEGIINFESLWYYFDQIDTIYKIEYLDEEICFKYKFFSTSVNHQGEELLILNGSVIVPFKNELNIYELEYQFGKFSGNKKIDTLKISVLREEDKIKFGSYGDLTKNIYKNISHMELKGKQYTKDYDSISRGINVPLVSRDKNERIIIDYAGMESYGSTMHDFCFEKQIDVINDEDKVILFPFVSIFNLGINKDWGIAHIKNLHTIKYNDTAFDYLVLEPNKKTLIKALITNKEKTKKYEDFIESKGNGLVFLLYGSPGLGKSLTVEAISEHMKKPLYSINCGDLGVNPDSLEDIMNLILVYSKRWNALILIDEVDIFIEERVSTDIVRNAMVGIFLKLLEYHDGIIFLTTNRLASLDSAIKSRINLMLSYKDLDIDKRTQIWKALCSKWNIELKDATIQSLSSYQLNGREIRNYIKLVLSVHETENKKITDSSFVKELKKCFQITDEFNLSIGKPSSLYS